MSNYVYLQGGDGTDITVPAGSSIAVYSRDEVTVFYKGSGVPGRPDVFYKSGVALPDVDTVFGPFTNQTIVRLDAGAAEVFYSVGTAPTVLERKSAVYQSTPVALNATGSITSASILGGIVTSTTAAAVAGTLPTGAVLDAANTLAIGEAFDWSVINTGGNTFTVTAATGHTIVGTATVATNVSGRFRTLKTAASTFVTYRLS